MSSNFDKCVLKKYPKYKQAIKFCFRDTIYVQYNSDLVPFTGNSTKPEALLFFLESYTILNSSAVKGHS